MCVLSFNDFEMLKIPLDKKMLAPCRKSVIEMLMFVIRDWRLSSKGAARESAREKRGESEEFSELSQPVTVSPGHRGGREGESDQSHTEQGQAAESDFCLFP